MSYSITTATRKILNLNKRIRAVQGGTSASKTVSIILFLIQESQSDKTEKLTSIVSESFPHLRRGAMKEFLSIMKEHNYYEDNRWDKTNSVYTFETGSKIELFSVDESDKVRGARRDRLFINEANNVNFSAFEELEIRTKDYIFLDWNPVREFWFDTEIKGKRQDIDFIVLTYQDNEAIPPEIKATIEQRRNRKGWWQVYGEGQLGDIEGKIFSDWQIIDEIPHEARLERYGLDFGYTNDPTAIVAIYFYNGGYILDEIAYQKGLSNKEIADILNNVDKALVIADSAEPKSIDEIKSYGINIIGCSKGPGSVSQRIQFVQDQRISVTVGSVNTIHSYRNYLWKVDRNGIILNEPEHQFSHPMDAVCYGMQDIRPTKPFIKRPFYDKTVEIWNGK